MLSTNIKSVKAQTCQDLEQIFLVDHTRKGIQAADRALHEYRERVSGRYVYILDDDCVLIDPDFVQLVKEAIEDDPHGSPNLIMVKSRRPPGPPSMSSIVPTPKAWGATLYHGACNCLCYVMKATLWKEHIKEFGAKAWGGDWWFLEQVLATGPTICWLDRVVADCRQLGRGRIFETNKADWFAPVAKEHGLVEVKKGDWRLLLWQV